METQQSVNPGVNQPVRERVPLSEFGVSDYNDIPEERFTARVKDVFGEVCTGQFGKTKVIVLDLDSPFATADRPHLVRYNYQKWDAGLNAGKGGWKDMHKKSSAGILLEALTQVEVPGTKKPGIKLENGFESMKDETFDWVKRTIKRRDGDEYYVTVPVKWHQPTTQAAPAPEPAPAPQTARRR